MEKDIVSDKQIERNQLAQIVEFVKGCVEWNQKNGGIYKS
jgi:hypothetical protein